MNPVVQTAAQTLKARGVKVKSSAQRNLNFVGKKVSAFSVVAAKAMVRILNGEEDFAGLGEVYESSSYVEPSQAKLYEDVYGENDWTNGAQDPDVRLSLEQIFGNVDGVTSDVSEEALLTVLGSAGAVSNTRNFIEKSKLLALAQSLSSIIEDDLTTGVRGVEDVDADLERYR